MLALKGRITMLRNWVELCEICNGVDIFNMHTHLFLAIHGCGMQGSPPAAHGHVDGGPTVNEPLYKFQLALIGRLDQKTKDKG